MSTLSKSSGEVAQRAVLEPKRVVDARRHPGKRRVHGLGPGALIAAERAQQEAVVANVVGGPVLDVQDKTGPSAADFAHADESEFVRTRRRGAHVLLIHATDCVAA